MKLFSLHSRHYIVTGAAGLLGIQHCRAILQNQGIPVLIDISKDSLNKTVMKLEKEFNLKIPHYLCDITKEIDLRRVSSSLKEKKIDIFGLINNAAINPSADQSDSKKNFTRFENFDLKQWELELSVGLTGSMLCSKVFSELLLANDIPGVILNISSDLGLIAPNQNLYKQDSLQDYEQPVKPVTYSVIKTGLIGLTRYISTYYEGKIRSNAICPGGVRNNQSKDFMEKLENLIPIKRMAEKEDFMGLIVFLLSDASSYINGAVIPIDGGRTAW